MRSSAHLRTCWTLFVQSKKQKLVCEANLPLYFLNLEPLFLIVYLILPQGAKQNVTVITVLKISNEKKLGEILLGVG